MTEMGDIGTERAGTGRRAVRGLTAAVAAGLCLGLPGVAVSASGSAPAQLTPAHGGPFAPVRGDWEGSADGFPVSFQVGTTGDASPRVTFDRLVALVPASCPVSASTYSEQIMDSTRPALVPANGTFKVFAFSGAFTGPRTVKLSERYRSGRCTGTLRWTLHPARRTTVTDGTWRLRFAGGETATAHVAAGGRVLTGLRLPRALKACNGTSGNVDLFIGPSGRARLSSSAVRVAMRLARRSATGTVNAGGAGCRSGPISFTARPR